LRLRSVTASLRGRSMCSDRLRGGETTPRWSHSGRATMANWRGCLYYLRYSPVGVSFL